MSAPTAEVRAVNLDALKTADQLRAWAAEHEGLGIVDRDGIKKLVAFAESRAYALDMKRDGNAVGLAFWEKRCDEIYAEIPEHLRFWKRPKKRAARKTTTQRKKA